MTEVEDALGPFAPCGDVLELAAGTGIWTPSELETLVEPLCFGLSLHETANGRFLYGGGS